MAADPFYRVCAVTGELGTRSDPIEWHHNLIFGGKQVQEKFCILPIKRSIHAKANDKVVKGRLDWIMLSRATPAQLTQYSKAIDRHFHLAVLQKLYGHYVPDMVEEAINY